MPLVRVRTQPSGISNPMVMGEFRRPISAVSINLNNLIGEIKYYFAPGTGTLINSFEGWLSDEHLEFMLSYIENWYNITNKIDRSLPKPQLIASAIEIINRYKNMIPNVIFDMLETLKLYS